MAHLMDSTAVYYRVGNNSPGLFNNYVARYPTGGVVEGVYFIDFEWARESEEAFDVEIEINDNLIGVLSPPKMIDPNVMIIQRLNFVDVLKKNNQISVRSVDPTKRFYLGSIRQFFYQDDD